MLKNLIFEIKYRTSRIKPEVEAFIAGIFVKYLAYKYKTPTDDDRNNECMPWLAPCTKEELEEMMSAPDENYKEELLRKLMGGE